MKTKLVILSALLIFFSAPSIAQFTVGIKGGANINKITGQSFKDEFSFGYHIGAFATLGLGGRLALQPEVLFNQVNTDTTSNFSSVYHFKNSSINLNYLSIPVLLNYKLTRMFSLQAGPQFGILMDKSKNLWQNGNAAFKNGDLSMLGGIQIKLLKFRIYGRYAIGLDNINQLGNSDKWKSQSIQLGVGLAL